MKPWFPPCQVKESSSHRGRWMPGGQILAAAPQDSVPQGPNHAVLWLLFKFASSQINRSNIRKEKILSWPCCAFSCLYWSKLPGLLAQDADPLENPFIPMGFQHSQSSEPGPGRTWVLQLLVPSLTCFPTWAELRTMQIWRRSGYFWDLKSSGCGPGMSGITLCPVLSSCVKHLSTDNAKLPLPDWAMPGVTELPCQALELLSSCPDFPLGMFAWLETTGLSQPGWRELGGGHRSIWWAADHCLFPGSASSTGSDTSTRHTEQIMSLQPSELWHLWEFTGKPHHLCKTPRDNHEGRK